MVDNNSFFEDINSNNSGGYKDFNNFNHNKDEKKFPVLLLILAGVLGLLIAILISQMLSSSKNSSNESTVEVVAPVTEISEPVDQDGGDVVNVYSQVKPGDSTLNTAPLQTGPAQKPIQEKEVKVISPAKTINLSSGSSSSSSSSSTSGGSQVQLAAGATEKAAEAEWTRLKKNHSDLLGDKSHTVVKSVVSGKTVYRLRVTSLTSTEATSLCKSLNARGVSCWKAK